MPIQARVFHDRLDRTRTLTRVRNVSQEFGESKRVSHAIALTRSSSSLLSNVICPVKAGEVHKFLACQRMWQHATHRNPRRQPGPFPTSHAGNIRSDHPDEDGGLQRDTEPQPDDGLPTIASVEPGPNTRCQVSFPAFQRILKSGPSPARGRGGQPSRCAIRMVIPRLFSADASTRSA